MDKQENIPEREGKEQQHYSKFPCELTMVLGSNSCDSSAAATSAWRSRFEQPEQGIIQYWFKIRPECTMSYWDRPNAGAVATLEFLEIALRHHKDTGCTLTILIRRADDGPDDPPHRTFVSDDPLDMIRNISAIHIELDNEYSAAADDRIFTGDNDDDDDDDNDTEEGEWAPVRYRLPVWVTIYNILKHQIGLPHSK